MDDFAIRIYLTEASNQAQMALSAVRSLNHALGRTSSQDISHQERRYFHREVFRSIHSLLTHSSNLSKLFWPPHKNGEPGRRRAQRGATLRGVIGLPDDGHLLKQRRIRDHLEHFDERLDSWNNPEARRNFVQDTIGPPEAIQGVDEGDMMRGYDPNSRNFTFRGERYDLQALSDCLQELLQALPEDVRL